MLARPQVKLDRSRQAVSIAVLRRSKSCAPGRPARRRAVEHRVGRRRTPENMTMSLSRKIQKP